MKLFYKVIIAQFLLLISSCQGLEDFVPPRFKQNLCLTAVLKAENGQNSILIEQSYQDYYEDVQNLHLEDLSVSIRSENGSIFEYYNSKTRTKSDTIRLPELNFQTNQKYRVEASAKDLPAIFSEIKVPESPTDLNVIDEGIVQSILPAPFQCRNPVKSHVLNLNFISEKSSYYYFDIRGTINRPSSNLFNLDYSILESNTPYFKSVLYNSSSLTYERCGLSIVSFLPLHGAFVYFIDGKTIPNNQCNMKVKIEIGNDWLDYSKPIIISLYSIPEAFYKYAKTCKTFLESSRDPFSEPVYIDGNIKGGNGIFAICSSKQYSLVLNKPN